MQIFKISIPKNSLIASALPVTHYSDCFYAQFNGGQAISLVNCIRYIFYNWPVWILFLFQLRNILVKPFGLESSNDGFKKVTIPVINISKGGKVSIFDVIEYNDEEVLLCASDKHLDCYLSFILKNFNFSYEVILTTVVKYNNNLGRIYFFCIKPFHKIIIRSMLNRLADHFTQNN